MNITMLDLKEMITDLLQKCENYCELSMMKKCLVDMLKTKCDYKEITINQFKILEEHTVKEMKKYRKGKIVKGVRIYVVRTIFKKIG